MPLLPTAKAPANPANNAPAALFGILSRYRESAAVSAQAPALGAQEPSDSISEWLIPEMFLFEDGRNILVTRAYGDGMPMG
jgi:hypothetical protein